MDLSDGSDVDDECQNELDEDDLLGGSDDEDTSVTKEVEEKVECQAIQSSQESSDNNRTDEKDESLLDYGDEEMGGDEEYLDLALGDEEDGLELISPSNDPSVPEISPVKFRPSLVPPPPPSEKTHTPPPLLIEVPKVRLDSGNEEEEETEGSSFVDESGEEEEEEKVERTRFQNEREPVKLPPVERPQQIRSLGDHGKGGWTSFNNQSNQHHHQRPRGNANFRGMRNPNMMQHGSPPQHGNRRPPFMPQRPHHPSPRHEQQNKVKVINSEEGQSQLPGEMFTDFNKPILANCQNIIQKSPTKMSNVIQNSNPPPNASPAKTNSESSSTAKTIQPVQAAPPPPKPTIEEVKVKQEPPKTQPPQPVTVVKIENVIESKKGVVKPVVVQGQNRQNNNNNGKNNVGNRLEVGIVRPHSVHNNNNNNNNRQRFGNNEKFNNRGPGPRAQNQNPFFPRGRDLPFMPPQNNNMPNNLNRMPGQLQQHQQQQQQNRMFREPNPFFIPPQNGPPPPFLPPQNFPILPQMPHSQPPFNPIGNIGMNVMNNVNNMPNIFAQNFGPPQQLLPQTWDFPSHLQHQQQQSNQQQNFMDMNNMGHLINLNPPNQFIVAQQQQQQEIEEKERALKEAQEKFLAFTSSGVKKRREYDDNDDDDRNYNKRRYNSPPRGEYGNSSSSSSSIGGGVRDYIPFNSSGKHYQHRYEERLKPAPLLPPAHDSKSEEIRQIVIESKKELGIDDEYMAKIEEQKRKREEIMSRKALARKGATSGEIHVNPRTFKGNLSALLGSSPTKKLDLFNSSPSTSSSASGGGVRNQSEKKKSSKKEKVKKPKTILRVTKNSKGDVIHMEKLLKVSSR